MKCLNCGKEFSARTVNHMYCCIKCGKEYRKKHGGGIYLITSFRCATCGKLVVTDGIRDKRTRFCCESCEKKFWKHPPSEHSALKNWHSMEEYESYERRSNE